MYHYTLLFITGVPAMVPGVKVIKNTINGNIVTLKLSWGEPFNSLDPIVNYTVSCSGDGTCPPNFTTTDNTTRSYTVQNLLMPGANYTFSIVATNSIGSGEAGVVMITTPPGENISENRIFAIVHSYVYMKALQRITQIITCNYITLLFPCCSFKLTV